MKTLPTQASHSGKDRRSSCSAREITFEYHHDSRKKQIPDGLLSAGFSKRLTCVKLKERIVSIIVEIKAWDEVEQAIEAIYTNAGKDCPAASEQ